MSTPTTPPPASPPDTATLILELRRAAVSITEHTEAEDQPLADFCHTHDRLGGPDTIARLAAGQITEADLDRYLPHYRTAAATLGFEPPDSLALFDDLSTARAVRQHSWRLVKSQTLASIIIIKGETGCGKTAALDLIRDKYNPLNPQPCVFRVEASAAWNDKPSNMLGAMLRALNLDPGRPDAGRRKDKLIETILARGGLTMFQFDEVHDMKVRCLRTLKTLINESQRKLKVQLACHKRLFRTIEAEYADDLSQLTGNRLLAIIELHAPSVEDITLLVTRRLAAMKKAEVEKTAKRLAQDARLNGNLAFVREVLIRAQERATKQAAPLTYNDLEPLIRTELRARAKSSSILTA